MTPKQDVYQSTSVAVVISLFERTIDVATVKLSIKMLFLFHFVLNSVDAHDRIYNLINTAIIEGKIILRAVTFLFAHKVPLYFPSFFLNGLDIDGRG